MFTFMTSKYIFPTLLQTSNDLPLFSSFKARQYINPKKKKRKRVKFKVTYKDTIKIKLHLTDKQKTKLKLFLNDVIKVYNLTNNHIKDNNLNKKDLNFIKLRAILKDDLKNICSTNSLPKHTADYAVKHCVEMYKSAYANHHKDFNIKDMTLDRRRKNLVIEPLQFSKVHNTFFSLGNIESTLPFKDNITSNSILQYDSFKGTFIIISPKDVTSKFKYKKHSKCGIDIGVRTFLTTYSKDRATEIGYDTNKIIDRHHKRLDNIRSSYDDNIIKESLFKDLYTKYSDKLKNKIKDLHNKAANFLLKTYETINIGNLSIKNMISNLKGNLADVVKRRLVTLSHYNFRMKLHSMKLKFGTIVNEINEFQTSIKCHNCKFLKRDLGKSKTYNCKKCKLTLDRDINAAINIYKLK